MISAYAVVPLVFGIVLSYLWLIHRLWLRNIFREDHKPTVDTKIAGEVESRSESNLGWPGKMVAARIACRTMKARTEFPPLPRVGCV